MSDFHLYLTLCALLVAAMRKKKGSKQLVPGKLVVDNKYLSVQRHTGMVAGLAFMHDFQKILGKLRTFSQRFRSSSQVGARFRNEKR